MTELSIFDFQFLIEDIADLCEAVMIVVSSLDTTLSIPLAPFLCQNSGMADEWGQRNELLVAVGADKIIDPPRGRCHRREHERQRECRWRLEL